MAKKNFFDSLNSQINGEDNEENNNHKNTDVTVLANNAEENTTSKEIVPAELNANSTIKETLQENNKINTNHIPVSLLSPGLLSVIAHAKTIDFTDSSVAKMTIQKIHNKKIKKLAAEFDVTSQGFLDGIIADFFSQNEKEIQKWLKKGMKD